MNIAKPTRAHHRASCVANLLAVGLLFVPLLALAQSASTAQPNPSESYARATILLVDSAKGVSSYDEKAVPGEGRELEVRADANVPGACMIAAFSKATRKVPENLQPIFAVMEQPFSEVSFPQAPQTWSFDRKSDAIEVYVVVFRQGDVKAKEAEQLVREIFAANRDKQSKILARQSQALHQLIQDWLRERSPAEFAPRYRPPTAAVVTRGSDIRWQKDLSYRATLPERAPALLMFTVGG